MMTIRNEETATLWDWVRCYAHDIARNPALLTGLVPDPTFTASKVAAQLEQWDIERGYRRRRPGEVLTPLSGNVPPYGHKSLKNPENKALKKARHGAYL